MRNEYAAKYGVATVADIQVVRTNPDLYWHPCTDG